MSRNNKPKTRERLLCAVCVSSESQETLKGRESETDEASGYSDGTGSLFQDAKIDSYSAWAHACEQSWYTISGCRFLHVWTPTFSFVCSSGRVVVLQKQQRAEGRQLGREESSVNYLLIQFGRWLPKNAEGSAQLRMRESRQSTAQKSRGLPLRLAKCYQQPSDAEPPGRTASLSLPRYLHPLSSLFHSHSTSPAFLLSFTSNLCPLASHFFSWLDISSSSPHPHCFCSCNICVWNLTVLFPSLLLYHSTPLYSPSLCYLSLSLTLSRSPVCSPFSPLPPLSFH